MRRAVLITGGTLAAVAAAAFARGRLEGRGPETRVSSEEDLQYTRFAPGGPQGFFFNGPIGWVFAKVQPFSHAGLYDVAADMLDLRPEDELLDIGCGPGAFMASRAQHVRRVVGLDPSRVMLHEARKRLADRMAAGTAQLVLGSSAELPFGDGEFSAATAITAPVNLAEVFRVLRPGGRFVLIDELIPEPGKPSSQRAGGDPRNWTEAETLQVIRKAGFVDLAVRYQGVWHLADNRIVGCHKPASTGSTAAGSGGMRMDTDEAGVATAGDRATLPVQVEPDVQRV